MKIVGISGSLRKESFNTKLLEVIQKMAPVGSTIELLPIGDLPLFNQDIEQDPPEAVKKFKEAISSADGVIFVTPEYNRSIPGVLKNAIDWGSRPYGHNSFEKKPVLVAGVSTGKIGTALAQSHLKSTMLFLHTHLVTHPEMYVGPANTVFNESGGVDSATESLITAGLNALIAEFESINK